MVIVVVLEGCLVVWVIELDVVVGCGVSVELGVGVVGGIGVGLFVVGGWYQLGVVIIVEYMYFVDDFVDVELIVIGEG